MKKALVILLLAAFLLPSAFAADQSAKYNYNLSDYKKATGKTITKFSEAPMLAKLVAEKKLPPVEQRLPKNPLVRIPMGEVGQYGGTIRWIEPSPVYSAIFRGFNLGALLNIPPSPIYTTETTDVQGPTDPGILESWSMSADGKTFTGKIREGLKWSDGVAVTTEDVEYAVKYVALNKEINPVTPRWMNWGGRSCRSSTSTRSD
jgi:peptide/nickel transport system substrate-binding protein